MIYKKYHFNKKKKLIKYYYLFIVLLKKMNLSNQTQKYKIFIKKIIKISEYEEEFMLLNKFYLDNIENKTIKELKELLYKKNKKYCPCKLKLYLNVEDGIVYSDYNDNPRKKIYFLYWNF